MGKTSHMDPETVVIEMKDIVKKFGDFTANDHISLTVHRGEVHAILGENGAGKSTMMNVLCGLYKPTSGEILINGKEVRFASPKDAIDMGIGMVLAVNPADADKAVKAAAEAGVEAYVIGEVQEGEKGVTLC